MTRPCAAANCNCENFLTPKSGNVKKCANMECNHPLGAHQVTVPPESRKHQTSTRDIITLDEEEEGEEDIRALQKSRSHSSLKTTKYSVSGSTIPSRSAMVVASRSQPDSSSSLQQLSFKDEVIFARQKANTIDARWSVGGSRYEPISLSAELRTTIRQPKPIQVKTTIWTRQDGSHMVKENNTQWWDFPLDEMLEKYNRCLIERILAHTEWLERKGGKEIGMDVSREQPILVG